MMDLAAVVLQSAGSTSPDATTWIIGILVTILIAVLAAMGAIIKVAYDASQKLGVTLYGAEDGENGGFISESIKRHEELQQQHEKVYEQLLIQGRLLSELAYAFSDIAEELNDEEDLNISVNLDRIEDLREKKDDERYGVDPDSADD